MSDDTIHLERLLAADELASVGRHDLRNRLATLRNAALFIQKALTKAGVLDEQARVAEFLGLIHEELTRADDLIEEVLLFEPRLPRGEPLSVADLVRALEDELGSVPIEATCASDSSVGLCAAEVALLAGYLARLAGDEGPGSVSVEISAVDDHLRLLLRLRRPISDASFDASGLLTRSASEGRLSDAELLRRLARRVRGQVRASPGDDGQGQLEVLLYPRRGNGSEGEA